MSLQRWLIRVLDGLIVLLVVWLLAAAAYVSVGRQFVPAIADYRQDLVAWAEESTGRAVAVDSLRGEMQGWQPVLEMQGLRVHEQRDEASPILLALDNVTARIDIWTSLWQRRPVMDAIQVRGLALELIEQADGRWRLHGLGALQAGQLDLDAALDTLFDQRRITLLDTRVVVSPLERPQWVFEEGEFTLLNGQGWHRLDGRVSLPGGQRVSWQVSAVQEGEHWQDMSVGFYLDLPPTDWIDQLPPAWLEKVGLQQVVAGGEFWGGWQDRQLRNLRGRLDVPLLHMGLAEDAMQLSDLGAEFAFTSAPLQQLQVQGLGFSLAEKRWAPSRLLLQRDVGTGAWSMQADRLDLDLLAQMLPTSLLPERAGTALTELAPTGVLNSVTLQGKGGADDWRDLRLSAMLENVGVQAWQGTPAVQGISGGLSGSPAQGALKVRSGAWSMHLPRLFPQPWSYDELVGEIGWRWSEAGGLRLAAPGMRAQGADGVAAVALKLHLPGQDGEPTMDLRTSLTETRARFSQGYLPTLSPAFNPKLGQWLSQAQVKGSVPLAVFEYQGSLRRDAEAGARRIALYARLESGSLAFQADWPRLEQVNATLHVNNQHIRVDQASARLWETDLSDVRLTSGPAGSGQGQTLSVQSTFAGPLGDGLRLMQDTPLAAASRDSLQGWEGEGQLSGAFQLQLPLREGAAPVVDANWRLEAQRVFIPQLQAPLTGVTGTFGFATATGLRADELSARFLGGQVRGSVTSEGGRLQATLAGQQGIGDLTAWPPLTKLPAEIISGDLAWTARGTLGGGESSLQVESELRGVTIDLPGALAKPSEQSLPSSLVLTSAGDGQRWHFNIGAALRGVLHSAPDGLRGDLRYRSGEPSMQPPPGVSLVARLEQLDLAQWREWGASNSALLPTEDSGGSAPGTGLRPSAAVTQFNALDIRAARFSGFGQELQDLAVSGVRSDAGWLFDVDQARVRGQVTVPDVQTAPVVVNLQRLALAKEQAEPRVDALASPLVPEDPLLGVDPAALPPLDVSIETLFWGPDPVGKVQFQLRPDEQGARITGLEIDLRGLQLAGDIDWDRSPAASQFRGTLQAGNIAQVLQAWGYTPTLTSRQFSTVADLRWLGSPAFFALSRSSGSLQLDASNGTLQSGEGSADALRVFGLLNFNALTRRLRLDFSDLFGRGTAYDTLTADLALTDGVMRTSTPLVMDGPGAKLQLEGHIDLPASSIDMGMLVTLPVTNNLPLAAIIAGAPYIGGALFLADKILGDRVARFASVKYRVSGDWQQPTVDFERAFDDEAALEE